MQAPGDPILRGEFAQFAQNVVQTLPSVKTFIVGNEPNLNLFWAPQYGPNGGDAAAASRKRTDRDLPLTFVLGGAVALVLIIALLPNLPGNFPGSLFMGLLIVIFGFFFVTVSSRIVGIAINI